MALFGRENIHDQQREAAYRAWFARQHPLALAAVVLSVFSLTHGGTLFVDELAGITLGVIALRQLKRAETARPTSLAWLGIIIGALSLACGITLYLWPVR